MWIYDLKTLKILKINHAAMSNYGYSSHEFHSLTILDIHPPGEEKDTLKMLNNFEAPYKNSGVWKHQKKDGTNIFVHITSNLILSTRGKQVMMMASDITQRVEDEQSLKELNKGLVKQNVMLAEIAWSQSHDVRRPLASIMGLTHLMQISDNEQDKQQCIDLIEKSAQDLDSMIKNTSEQIDLAMFKN